MILRAYATDSFRDFEFETDEKCVRSLVQTCNS